MPKTKQQPIRSHEVPKNRVSVSAVAPKWNVRKNEEVKGAFDIINVSHVQGNKFGGRDAITWRVYAVDCDTGEQFLMLYQGNQMRDETFGKMEDVFQKDADAIIGPCILETVPLEGKQTTYNIIEYSE